MSQRIAESENMNAPCYNIIEIDLIHVLPNNSMMISKSKCMNIEFRSCSEDISLSTKFFFLSKCKHLNSDSIDSIMLIVGEVY